jgi:hypothetical protein
MRCQKDITSCVSGPILALTGHAIRFSVPAKERDCLTASSADRGPPHWCAPQLHKNISTTTPPGNVAPNNSAVPRSALLHHGCPRRCCWPVGQLYVQLLLTRPDRVRLRLLYRARYRPERLEPAAAQEPQRAPGRLPPASCYWQHRHIRHRPIQVLLRQPEEGV